MLKPKLTKRATVERLLKMAVGLREKYKASASVDIDVWAYELTLEDQERAKYSIYVEGWVNAEFEGWRDCQEKYFELMEAGNAQAK
jgi:hypothetical protein